MPPTAITVPVEQDSGAARLEAAEQRLPETLDPESLRKYFTLTETDLQEVAVCRGVVNKLGFAVQLCTLRWQGYFLGDTRGLPAPVLETTRPSAGPLAHVDRRLRVTSSSGTEMRAKVFSFLNTRSDFLTVAVVPALPATPSAALGGSASSAPVAARPTHGDPLPRSSVECRGGA